MEKIYLKMYKNAQNVQKCIRRCFPGGNNYFCPPSAHSSFFFILFSHGTSQCTSAIVSLCTITRVCQRTIMLVYCTSVAVHQCPSDRALKCSTLVFQCTSAIVSLCTCQSVLVYYHASDLVCKCTVLYQCRSDRALKCSTLVY